PSFEMDYMERVVTVAMSTAAAPSYFPTYKSAKGVPFIDGGVWANNPVGVAAVEAVSILKWYPEQIRILSIGCTQEPANSKWAQRFKMGGLYWAVKATDAFMAGQSSGSLGMAQHLVGHKNVFRYNPIVLAKKYGLDVLKELNSLAGLGYSEA